MATGETPLVLGEKSITMPADGTVIEKFFIPSAAMDRHVRVFVVLPPAYASAPGGRFPALYTLHGSGAPYATFGEMAPLRAALANQPMLVVGFDGDKEGWYIDSPLRRDSQFETFFFQELIPYIERNYRVIREARGVTGFSMGGFGAFHYMLAYPEMFAGVSALSGVFGIVPGPAGVEAPPAEPVYATRRNLREDGLVALLGDPDQNKGAYERVDVMHGLEVAVAKGVRLPPLYLTCGAEDSLLRESRVLRDWLSEKRIPCEYVEKPGGHDWPFWRGSSAEIIDFHWRSFQGGPTHPDSPAAAPEQAERGKK